MKKDEFKNASDLLTRLLSVPHAEIKKKLEEEKAVRKRKKAKKPSASREANDRA